jgi:hypothetical protein
VCEIPIKQSSGHNPIIGLYGLIRPFRRLKQFASKLILEGKELLSLPKNSKFTNDVALSSLVT